MAHIVPFRVVTERAAPDAEAGTPPGAQIIIFPGVRRERHAEPAALAPQPSHPWAEVRRKRDVLELPD